MKENEMLQTKVNRKAIAGVAAAVLAIGFVATAEFASAASIDSQLRSAVQLLIMNMKEGPVSKLNAAERKELAGCIYGVMSGIPERKRNISSRQRARLNFAPASTRSASRTEPR
jgi:hypothetical protein